MFKLGWSPSADALSPRSAATPAAPPRLQVHDRPTDHPNEDEIVYFCFPGYLGPRTPNWETMDLCHAALRSWVIGTQEYEVEENVAESLMEEVLRANTADNNILDKLFCHGTRPHGKLPGEVDVDAPNPSSGQEHAASPALSDISPIIILHPKRKPGASTSLSHERGLKRTILVHLHSLRGVEVEREGELDEATEVTDAIEGVFAWDAGREAILPHLLLPHLNLCVGLGHCAIATHCHIAYGDLHKPGMASQSPRFSVRTYALAVLALRMCTRDLDWFSRAIIFRALVLCCPCKKRGRERDARGQRGLSVLERVMTRWVQGLDKL
ncbi:hypothetical protein C8Q74DRAFT_1434881 [Fomes fomentarius]|nr:hypothetical protein C8Q74DRAFT_1434881 [Fomes fomentarius]